MEPRKYCVDDKLVIKSDKENMQRVYAIVIGMIGVVVCWVLSFGDDYFSYVIMAIPLILLGWVHMAHPIGWVCGAKRPKCEAERSVSLCLMSQSPR